MNLNLLLLLFISSLSLVTPYVWLEAESDCSFPVVSKRSIEQSDADVLSGGGMRWLGSNRPAGSCSFSSTNNATHQFFIRS